MNSLSEDYIVLNDTCIQLADELIKSLDLERKYLIELRSEEILTNNHEKDRLLKELLQTRLRVRSSVALCFGETPDEENQDYLRWQAAQRRWEAKWSELARRTEENQDLLKHSLKNLEMLNENLKRLFGLHGTYNAKGNKVESDASGSVMRSQV